MVGTPCTPIPKASSRTERKAEIRSRSHAASAAASSSRPAAFYLAQHLLVAQIPPRDEEGVVSRLAVRSAASSFFGEGVERQGERGAGLVGGDVDLDPVVLGEPVDVVAPVVADVLAARLGQRRRGRPELEGEPLDLHQPLVLVGEDLAVGAHEIEVIPQSYDVSWLCRFSVSVTYPTPNCRASSAGSVVGLWQA